jgi:hypothetical protein
MHMRPVRTWLAAFIVLFVCYQAPEGIGGHWLREPAVAASLMLAFLPAAWLVARALGLSPGAAYALEWQRQSASILAAGLVLAFAAKGFALAIGLWFGIYTMSAAPAGANAPSAPAGLLAWMALSTFVPSIAEDILTRGFWARMPGWRWTGMRFVLFTSALYVLNHVYRLGNGPSEWLMLFCFGLAYATAFWRLGSLWAAVGLHWGWNFAGQALGLWWPVEWVEPGLGRMLSGAAHLLILAVVALLLPRPSTPDHADCRATAPLRQTR